MTAKKQKKSRILREIHEAANDLHEIDLIDKRRMREFDALCHIDIEEMSPTRIKALRNKTHVSQAVFAAVLNISPSTVQKWEIGDKKPVGSSLKLLNLIAHKGLDAVLC